MLRPWSFALPLVCLACRSATPLVPAGSAAAAGGTEQGAPPLPAQAPAAPVSPPLAVQLPTGWAGASEAHFHELLAQTFPAGERRTLVPSAFEELSSALRSDDALAVRSLALLSRCSDPLAGEILIQRLERRAAQPSEIGAAIDIAAAAALPAFPDARNVRDRLESLAYGRRPHPDLEVRVECACSALRLGRERAQAFLLGILKHGTRLAVASSAWKPIPVMDFCQRRAAEALSERAGRPCRFQPLQPLEQREEDIRALESQLAPGRN